MISSGTSYLPTHGMQTCFATDVLRSSVNYCQRSTNDFMLYSNTLITTITEPEFLYVILFVAGYVFRLNVFNFLSLSNMFLALSLICVRSFVPICRCSDGSLYGEFVFDIASVHIITFFAILAQNKRHNFPLDQILVLNTIGVVISISTSISVGNLSIFTMLVTYVELVAMGNLVELYKFINVICWLLGLVLNIVAIPLNAGLRPRIKRLGYINLTAIVFNMVCFLLQNKHNWRLLFAKRGHSQ